MMDKKNKIHTVPFHKVLFKSKQILKNPLPFHKKYFNKYGDTFAIKLNPKDKAIFTRDPILTKHVLQKDHRNWEKSFLQTEYLSKYLGYGLLTVNGDKWLTQRRLIQPAFHRKKNRCVNGYNGECHSCSIG